MIIGVIILVAVAIAVRGAAIMLLWNWLIPDLLHLSELSFFEGVGLYLLVALLFGSMTDQGNVWAKKNDKETKDK